MCKTLCQDYEPRSLLGRGREVYLEAAGRMRIKEVPKKYIINIRIQQIHEKCKRGRYLIDGIKKGCIMRCVLNCLQLVKVFYRQNEHSRSVLSCMGVGSTCGCLNLNQLNIQLIVLATFGMLSNDIVAESYNEQCYLNKEIVGAKHGSMKICGLCLENNKLILTFKGWPQ